MSPCVALAGAMARGWPSTSSHLPGCRSAQLRKSPMVIGISTRAAWAIPTSCGWQFVSAGWLGKGSFPLPGAAAASARGDTVQDLGGLALLAGRGTLADADLAHLNGAIGPGQLHRDRHLISPPGCWDGALPRPPRFWTVSAGKRGAVQS